jgi:hypothetical protein
MKLAFEFSLSLDIILVEEINMKNKQPEKKEKTLKEKIRELLWSNELIFPSKRNYYEDSRFNFFYKGDYGIHLLHDERILGPLLSYENQEAYLAREQIKYSTNGGPYSYKATRSHCVPPGFVRFFAILHDKEKDLLNGKAYGPYHLSKYYLAGDCYGEKVVDNSRIELVLVKSSRDCLDIKIDLKDIARSKNE